MATAQAREKVLARVLEEERRWRGPTLDGKRLEAGLLERLSRGEPAAPRPKPRLRWVALAAATIAIGALVAFDYTSATHSRGLTATSRETPPALAGDSLPLGHSIVTEARAVDVVHRGLAYWSLLPNSRASIVRRDSVVVIELESGALQASVEPRSAPETFVVQAGAIRAAVHGTRFEVRRTPEGVKVTVSEGLVMVSRAGDHESVSLQGPATSTFPETGAERDPQELAPAPLPETSAAPAAASRPQFGSHLPEEPTIVAVESGVAKVVGAVQRCFSDHTKPLGGVEVQVKSTIAFRVQPDGLIERVTFEPPVSPRVDACARTEIARVRFSRSRRGIALSRVLELRR